MPHNHTSFEGSLGSFLRGYARMSDNQSNPRCNRENRWWTTKYYRKYSTMYIMFN
jgi:hypothetical protein